MSARSVPLLSFFLAFACCSGCVNHIKPYEQRKRNYRPEFEVVEIERERSTGSIWSEYDNANRLFSDPRAARINDIVIVRIEEMSQAKQSVNTVLKKDSEIAAQIDALLGALKTFEGEHPNFDRKNLVNSKYKADFDGGGNTARVGSVIATVPVQIKREFPDGNLFIEGHRVILVNNEEAHFYVSGIIRPYDIDKNNSISSGMIADAQIEFTGRGVVTEKNRQGWGSRAMDYVWPF